MWAELLESSKESSSISAQELPQEQKSEEIEIVIDSGSDEGSSAPPKD
jgi:hypothetical protein